MSCYHPLSAYRSSYKLDGKYIIRFPPCDDLDFEPIRLPCGKCIGCRLEYSRVWAMRIMHESQMHVSSSFITLTFNDDYIDDNWSLDVKVFQRFMKRLRSRLPDVKLRFYHCGEYGDTFKRPHYHACLFGYDFPDREFYKISNGFRLYNSKFLDSVWGFGFCVIGDVTFESAAYVARYVTKKINGKPAFDHYLHHLDTETGEFVHFAKEYATMSRNPGIGRDWYDKYAVSDVYAKDYCTIRGAKCMPPRYYDNVFEIEYPSDFERIKERRLLNADLNKDDNTRARLLVKETVKKDKIKSLFRSFESDL